MSRSITVLRVTLTLRTPGGVTAPETGDPIDLPLARGPQHMDGAPYVPPSSLVGALRSHLGTDADRFLGPTPDAAELTPSPVRILGSRVTLPPGAATLVVRTTAIDPHRAAAQATTFRSRELLPAGTAVVCYLRCDDTSHDTQLAADLVARIGTWQPVLGRGRTTGHGRAAVTQVATRTLDLSTRVGLTAWLSGDLFPDGDQHYRVTAGAPTTVEPALQLTFQVVDPLVIGGGESSGTRGAPRTIYRQDGVPAVPGSTWKGVLRSRCAYILRSCRAEVCSPDQPCRTCAICRLFGYTRRGTAPGEPTGHAGTLLFATALVNHAQVTIRNRVAIDRFTGGARPGLLYAHEAITAGTVTLRIDTAAPLADSDRGLLLLAVRDLHDGLIGIGSATTRGCGTLRLDAPSQAALHELDADHPAGTAIRRLLAKGAA